MSSESTEPNATQPAPKKAAHVPFEPLALLLLSLSTVGTAWCSYQAATWSAVSQRTMNTSAAVSRQAFSYRLEAFQVALVDVLLFSQYVNARAETNADLARFYSERFRAEAKTAFNAWLATHPFEDTNAPPHPFVTNFYHPRLLVESKQANEESQRLWNQAGEAGRTGRTYVLVTVLLACALFCSGTASKFGTPWIHRVVLGVGLVTFALAAIRLFSLPIRL